MLHTGVASVAPGLTLHDMESGDCYERLREHGVHVSEAVQSIEPAVTNESEAALRQVE